MTISPNFERFLAFVDQMERVITWDINSKCKPDTTVSSEVEVRFISDGANATRVEVEHRKFEQMGVEAGESMRKDVDGGWPALLERFKTGRQALAELLEKDARPPDDWVIRKGEFMSFRDPREGPLARTEKIERTYHYVSLKQRTSANVVAKYEKDGKLKYVRHHAFEPRFWHLGAN